VFNSAHPARNAYRAKRNDFGMVSEEQLEERRRLLWHMDFFFRPPVAFYDDLERAIELAAAGRNDELTPIERDRVRASELIETYDLEEFVGRAQDRDGSAGPSDASIMHHDAEDYGGC
jgi:hypothetical protein